MFAVKAAARTIYDRRRSTAQGVKIGYNLNDDKREGRTSRVIIIKFATVLQLKAVSGGDAANGNCLLKETQPTRPSRHVFVFKLNCPTPTASNSQQQDN